MADKTYLDTVYDLEAGDTTRKFYDEWSESYDAEVSANGYATPGRAAAALKDAGADLAAPLLDIGCGTGISGAAFRGAGFQSVDGFDFSAEMLEKARAKGIYRTLVQTDLADPLPFDDGTYTQIAAVGVINPSHAPPETVDAVMAKLTPGGLFVFSLNDHALADPAFEARVNEQIDTGAAQLLFREHGTHLPKIDLCSTVYVLRKM